MYLVCVLFIVVYTALLSPTRILHFFFFKNPVVSIKFKAVPIKCNSSNVIPIYCNLHSFGLSKMLPRTLYFMILIMFLQCSTNLV